MAEKKLLEQLADKIRMRHYSRKTETAYVEPQAALMKGERCR
jgi:hypothetical protein